MDERIITTREMEDDGIIVLDLKQLMNILDKKMLKKI